MTDQPRSWAYSLRGFGVGWGGRRPGGGEGRRERRGRFVSVPKPGWTLSAGLRCVLGVLGWNRWTVRLWTVVDGKQKDRTRQRWLRTTKGVLQEPGNDSRATPSRWASAYCLGIGAQSPTAAVGPTPSSVIRHPASGIRLPPSAYRPPSSSRAAISSGSRRYWLRRTPTAPPPGWVSTNSGSWRRPKRA